MATVLYFATNTASYRASGTYPVTGTNYANLTPTTTVTTEGYMVPYPWNGVANLSVSTGTGTTAKITRFGRFFSPPFAQDYTYNHPLNSTDAIKYYLADYESNLSANHCVEQCYVYVWRPSTGAVVGVIQPVKVLAPGAKEPTSASSIRSTLGSYFAPSSGSIDILAGDILVFEPFSTYTKSSSTSYTVRFYYGGATEITAENTTVATPASKVVFSVDLPLKYPAGAAHSKILYKATLDLLGALLVTSATSKARLVSSKLKDGSPLNTVAKARASMSSALTARILMCASLKSISNVHGRLPQEVNLTSTAHSVAASCVAYPDTAAGELLSLYYSGTGTANSPNYSIGGVRGSIYEGLSVQVLSTSPGVSILAAHNLPEGTYTLHVDSYSKYLRLDIVPRMRSFGSTYDEGVSVLSVGAALSGYVVLRVDSAQATTTKVRFSVSVRDNTLFLNTTTASTEYRCLYLFNDTDRDVLDVSLSVATSFEGFLGIATEYASRTPVTGYQGATSPISTRHKASDLTGWGGVFSLHNELQIYSEQSANSLPIVVVAARNEQETDGVFVQVPDALDDEADSSGRLVSLTFGASLTWSRIKPRRGVTFWVKKSSTIDPGTIRYSAMFSIAASF